MATLRILLLFLVLISSGGCQKDVITKGEKTAQSIQAVANESNIILANIIAGIVQQYTGAAFMINGQFLFVLNSYG